MLKMQHYGLATLLFFTAGNLCANVQIESRGLSQGSSSTAVAMNVGTTPTSTNLNWQMMEKIQQLESDLRSLRGKIDEQENIIESLKKESENRYNDLDARLENLNEKLEPAEPETEAATEDNQQGTPPSTPLTSSNTTNNNTPTDAEKTAYTLALDAYKTGGAAKAIQPMKNFIQRYPNSVYISNAYFWLAEFLLAVEPTDFNAVKQHFSTVVNKYPNSAKASNALYRLFTIASNVDQNQTLAQQYKTQLLKNYPQSAEAKFVK